MRTVSSCLVLLLLVASSASAAPRRLEMSFEGQLTSAVSELRDKLKADFDLDGRKLRLAKFSGQNLPDSNFELEFERQFQVLAKDLLDDASPFLVRGEYDYVPGTRGNEGLRVVQFAVVVVSPQRRVLHEVVREVNDTGDIGRILGQTIAPPDTKDVDARNKAAEKAFEKPSFGLREGTRVTAAGNADYAVEVRRRVGGKGDPVVVTPQDKGGHAFVDLGLRDTFELVLFNYESKCDTVAKVTVDGLDVANEFSEDKARYDGYTVFRSSGTQPGTHTVPGWLRTTKQTSDNVFRFVVNELGKGAATARNSRSSRGVLTVQFFEAVPPGEALPARSFGEVGVGEPMTVKYDVQQMHLRKAPVATVSIRYSNPGPSHP